MRADELLGHADLQLPVARPGGDFLAFANTLLASFRQHVQTLVGADPLTQAALAAAPDMIATSNRAYRVVEEYLRGHPHGAYCELDAAIHPIRAHIDRLQSGSVGANQIKHLYRVRHQVAPPLTREEMFHLPFELRHKVATQRYSIPGLPSLYLGGSLYTCWVEMRQPVFADLQTACFWLRPGEQLCVVDFGHRPRWLSIWLSKNGAAPLPQQAIDYIISHLVCWPLVALASVRTKYPADPFKPEYVLPQVLLQWVCQ